MGCHETVGGQVNWVVVQHPCRGPAAGAVADAPAGHPFGACPLPTPEYLGGHTEQTQCFIGALHLPQGQAGHGDQAGIGE